MTNQIANENKYVVFDLDETIGHFILIRNIQFLQNASKTKQI